MKISIKKESAVGWFFMIFVAIAMLLGQSAFRGIFDDFGGWAFLLIGIVILTGYGIYDQIAGYRFWKRKIHKEMGAREGTGRETFRYDNKVVGVSEEDQAFLKGFVQAATRGQSYTIRIGRKADKYETRQYKN